MNPEIAFEASDPRVLEQFVVRGLGLAVLPERFVRSRPDQLHPEMRSPHLRAGLALAGSTVPAPSRSAGQARPADL